MKKFKLLSLILSLILLFQCLALPGFAAEVPETVPVQE